ncbi:tetratricopeptide repeat protein [Streptomyces sp. NBC_01450]|uniref:tetratricopeptide repeat protein n=1 Tax=Streptomyces sp. NBC_01450 TaxID=2903871 RepID=UPI002E37E5E1|nr:tetratricopeptide repeat protein [Streptomyces sp. NBC_01450]
MRRKRLWAGLTGAAAVATGVTAWAVQSHSATTPESEATSANSKAQQANTLFQSALLQEKYQDPEGAARTYQRVLRLDPRNKLAWYNLGVIAQRNDRTAEAREAYDKALKIDPKYASALYNEAILLKSSDTDRAVTLLKRAIAATPRAATAHLQLGWILAKKHRDDDAEAEFRRAVAADPSLYSQVPEQFRDAVSPTPTSSQEGVTG